MRERAARVFARFSALPPRQRGAVAIGLGALAAFALVALTATPASKTKVKALPEQDVITGVVEAAEQMAHEVKEEVVDPAVEAVRRPLNDIPDELEEEVQSMLESERATVRRRAAKAVLAHKPQSAVPAHLITIAKLESARRCKTRRAAIREMAEVADERFLPALTRLSQARKSGCGFLRLKDCYGCVRADLRQAIKAVKGD